MLFLLTLSLILLDIDILGQFSFIWSACMFIHVPYSMGNTNFKQNPRSFGKGGCTTNFVWRENHKKIQKRETTPPYNIGLMHFLIKITKVKVCVRYIFASLFLCLKESICETRKKCFLFHFESSSHSWDNQLLTFLTFKYHDVIKCPNMKHETHITE